MCVKFNPLLLLSTNYAGSSCQLLKYVLSAIVVAVSGRGEMHGGKTSSPKSA